MKTCDKFMDMIKMIYTSRSKIPEKKLNKLMKKDIYQVFIYYAKLHDISRKHINILKSELRKL